MAGEATTPTIMLLSTLSPVLSSSVFRSERFIPVAFYGMRFSLDCSMYSVRLKICILLQNSRTFLGGRGCYVFITSISLVPEHRHSILRINFTVRDSVVHEGFIGPS